MSSKMSDVPMTKVSTDRSLSDMPYEVLFEMFRSLRKDKFRKLIGLSKLCSKFRDVAGDKRFWKDVYIKYNPYEAPMYQTFFTLEELYSEPWPVKVIDLSRTRINPPVSSQINQVVKVEKLNLSSIKADGVTMEALLAKYQCTELNLDFSITKLSSHAWMRVIAPKAFLKQTALEVLSIFGDTNRPSPDNARGLWLEQVLSNCKNLKTLSLYWNHLNNSNMLCFARNSPKSLEKLTLLETYAEDSFFESLARSSPNLRELELCSANIAYPSLLKFQFLEALHLALHMNPVHNVEIIQLYIYLIKFPALKTVNICDDYILYSNFRENKLNLEILRTKLEPHGIRIVEVRSGPDRSYVENCSNNWVVSKAGQRTMYKKVFH